MPYVTMPATVPPPPPATVPPQRASGLATTALIVGIVAIFTGLAAVWGIILGATAVLFGIAALRKGQGKGRALTGLILGSLATLTSLIVTIVMVVGLISHPYSINDSNGDSSGSDLPVTESQPEAPEPGVGTRENPDPAGTKVVSADWTVTINSYNPEADSAVSGGSHNNPNAPEGSHYEMVNYTVNYKGTSTAYASDVAVSLVTSSNVVLQYAFVILDDRIPYTEFHGAGSATGSKAFLVPDGESVIIRVSPGFYAEDSFIAPW